MLAATIAVKVSSPGPLIFKQERVGLHNRTFKMYKFRSMTVQKASEEVKQMDDKERCESDSGWPLYKKNKY